jgi:chitin disaccharide deacetylase
MAGLDPANQRAAGAKGFTRRREGRGVLFFSASSASPREIFLSLADARWLGGRVKPGHGGGWDVKNLIITADDFGAAREVNDAVEQAHRSGALTAASLMVTGPAATDAIVRARAMPSLRVGLHLVLVDGRPALPAAQIPSLVDADGFFRNDMARAGAAMFFLPHVRRQLAAEIEAQFQAFAATGLPLDHVNAHKHFHMHPTIAALLIATGKRYGLKAARAPYEPAKVLTEIELRAKRRGASALVPFAKSLSRRLSRAGLLVPDQVFGLTWSGAMTNQRLQGLIDHLPEGLSEIYLHPATGPYPGSAAGYRYAEELAALQAVQIPKDVRRGGFADFAPGATLAS